MDIFRFHNPTSDTKLEQGEIINGFKSKMWIERYRDAGEFKLIANVSTSMREKLPIGSLISHVDSTEVMIVENHEISVTHGKESDIVITGRGFETYFEQRIVGSNRALPSVLAWTEGYGLVANETWHQTVLMIQDHILAANLIDDNNSLPYISILTDIVAVGFSAARLIQRGDLYIRVIELLEIDDIGIKIIRPGLWSPLGASSPNIAILIHAGVDRTGQVMFSHDTGEIESADYLWSNKKLKNAAYITGKWVETWVDTADTNYDRRTMYIDATDIDEGFETAPVDADFVNIVAAMQQRGRDILARQNEVALTKAELSKTIDQLIYRVDFDVGDAVTVHGDYNETSSRRISEYVEIEDENGQIGYPTLTEF